MRLWEVLIAADRRLNLADREAYPGWFHAICRNQTTGISIEGDAARARVTDKSASSPVLGLMSFSGAWEDPDRQLWCPEIAEQWESGINGLRFAVRALRKGECRRPGVGGDVACGVWAHYVGLIRLGVSVRGGKFGGYRTPPALGSVVSRALWGALNERQRELAIAVGVLFLKAFTSLIDGLSAAHYCAGCGCELEALTPKGRVSRASSCKRCAQARWKAGLGQAALREQWKRDKARERKRDK